MGYEDVPGAQGADLGDAESVDLALHGHLLARGLEVHGLQVLAHLGHLVGILPLDGQALGEYVVRLGVDDRAGHGGLVNLAEGPVLFELLHDRPAVHAGLALGRYA